MVYPKVELGCCPVCQSSNVKFLFEKYDARYGYNDTFDIYTCGGCNCSFINNPIEEKYLGELYSNYYGADNYSEKEETKITFYSKLLKTLRLKKIYDYFTGNLSLGYFVKRNEKVLDYGCGNTLNQELGNISTSNWVGLEIDKNLVDRIRANGFKCYHGDLKNIENITEKFDVILMSQVIEHVYNPIVTIKNASKLLKKGGRILILTPNFDSKYRQKYNDDWINWHVPYHTILFSKHTFTYIASVLDMNITEYKTFTPVNWYLTQKNIKQNKIGSRNSSFKITPSILDIVKGSIYLKLFGGNSMHKDCIYIELNKKGE